MTGEMRAAESLVRALAPSGHAIPIPEPFAVDESHWLLLAVEQGLVEFGPCPATCREHESRFEGRSDHFDTDDGEPHHLFAGRGDEVVLRRDHVAAIAAWTRAVVELGHRREQSTLLRAHNRRMVHARFDADDGKAHLLIEARPDRQSVRRLATALDASGSLKRLRPDVAAELAHVATIRPAYLWIVGPSTIDPAVHVFRIEPDDVDGAHFTRVPSVPVPV